MDKEHIEQAKNRNTKVEITDIAIEKIPYINYKGLTEEQNIIMQQLAKDVLRLSKEKNDSNEVAVTCDLNAANPLEGYGIAFGTEHNVDVCSDTESYHLLMFAQNVMAVMLHNHPSTQTFSFQDLLFFYHYPIVRIMVMVSNQGKIHYLLRETSYDAVKFYGLCQHFYEVVKHEKSFGFVYDTTIKLLKNCYKAGVLYV